MDMIEVDPKLFVTCRLCLEEIGVYQIVPEVQKKIKYCFDLDISLFDGLPQLICKKCESMLSHHAVIKEMLHEKQKSLLIKLKGNIRSVTAPDLQKPSSSIPQSDAETEILVNYIEKSTLNQISTISKDEVNCTKQTANKSSCNNIFSDVGNNEHLTELKRNKSSKNRWRKNYSKQFVCKFCSLSLRHKTNIILHGEKCALMKKYSNMLKWCWVKLQNLNFTPNLTDSKENVVWEKNKIINSKNPNYYILYSLKTPRKSVSESSDENFTSNKKKRKRQRLMSVSSNETLVIDGNSNKENSKNNCIGESDIECVTLDDSDTASTLSTFVTKHDSLEINAENVKNQINEKMINNIVSICYNKYLKRLNVNVKNVKNYGNHDSFLQRKLLSMGRKIIHKEGFNPTGLLRYMEQKDLDVVWIEKAETNVSVRTTFKENKGDDLADIWKSLNKIDNNYKNKDFIDNFEKLSTSEADSTNSNLVFTNEVNTQDGQNVISSGIVLQQNVLFSSGNDSSPLTFSSHNSKNIKSPTGTYSKNNEKLLGCMYDKKIENNILYLRAPKESENNTMLHKILNASPVLNPKKLNARNLQDCLPAVDTTDSYNDDEILRDKEVPASVTSEKGSLHMPIITSTVSLAPNFNNQITSNEEQCPLSNEADTTPKVPEQTLPRIKVKPVSELMAEVPTHPKGIPTTASVWAGNFNENQNVYLQNIAPNIQLQSVPVYMSMVQPVNSVSAYPQIQAVQLNNITQGTSKSVQRSRQEVDDREYILMHTVELPQKKTHSPFQYFKDLLNIHKFELLNNAEAPTLSMSCIVKFKLVCKQEDVAPVSLCLSLLCDKNTFCIQVMDVNSTLLNVNNFSANWQWEILKAFRGNVVQAMLLNAKKFGQEMFDRIQYFTLLLSTIVVSRVS